MTVFVIAEVGINHNGDIDLCKKLIDVACDAGCNAVKFQKRTIEKVYSREFLNSNRESPWGSTQRDQKIGLEFEQDQFEEIDSYCKKKGIEWFASAWDIDSQYFLRQFNFNFNKVASPMIIDEDFLECIASEKKHTFISTGMSTLKEIDKATKIFQDSKCPFELMHCVSTYPTQPKDANLRVIETLRNRYRCNVGYSCHESGLAISFAATAFGITSLERHITLDRSMYGSDQAASIEPAGLRQLVGGIRKIELALGDGVKLFLDDELKIANKLREHIFLKNKIK